MRNEIVIICNVIRNDNDNNNDNNNNNNDK